MNWFTKRYVIDRSTEWKESMVVKHGGCEHVEKDPSLLFAISTENDSFGCESYCLCKVCDDAVEAEEGEKLQVCHDCHKSVKTKDGFEWKWYDFYAPQGDEPLFICNECRTKERHRNRVSKDREDYEEEMRRYD